MWNGNQDLLEFEQRVTLQNGAYAADLPYWRNLTNTRLPIPSAYSPIPGDASTFQSFRTADDAADIPDDASIGDLPSRWAWILRRQLPAYIGWSCQFVEYLYRLERILIRPVEAG